MLCFMKSLVKIFSAVVLAAVLSGCVSYEYKGESTGVPTSDVEVFSDSARIGRSYKVLGRAVVSGNYQDVSRERMMDTLLEKARSSGADAVLIVEQQVIPAGEVSRPVFDTAFDFNDTNRSWSQIEKDVDLTYGEIGKRRPPNIQSVSSYRRVIRAEFLKYTAPAKNTDPAGK